jgi:threonyl-tRNA synthetase
MLDEHDHRVLGRRMRLLHFQEEGPGMAFWHPRGLACLRLLEEQVRRVMVADGFQEVRTPQILARSLWERSGHWTAYREGLLMLPGPPERAGDDGVWDRAEAMLAAAHGLGRRVKEARELGIPWFLAVGDQEQAGGPFRFRPLRGPAVQRSQAEALDWLAEDGGA